MPALDLTALPSVAFGLETALLDLQTGGKQRLFDTAFSRGEAALPTHGLIWMGARSLCWSRSNKRSPKAAG